ncbi:MAG: sulfatase-like hydrolase/transferase [Gemmatimonadetes bacterium]|jgi:arylsulfatase A-like enzyme|nr:sulfatase-like hydrolase/transferase [Gemmatimonadota bacterium]
MTRERPHVLILMCDQMQAQRMGCAGDPHARTPFLDRLAGEGVRFTHMISVHGQCVPSRASFITGLAPHECGVVINYGFYDHQNRLAPGKHRTVGQSFRDAGYRTAYFGKCHFGLPLQSLGYDEGEDYDPRRVGDDEASERGIKSVPKSLRRDYVAAQDTIEWLADYEDDGRPLFLTFSTNLPHPPFFHDPDYAGNYDADSLPLPVSYYEDTFEGKPAFQKEHADGDHSAGDEAQAREELAQYLSMIEAMDAQFAAITAQLERLGMWEDTLVLFVADHGDMMGGHGISKKGTLPYDELYRVPCILKLPEAQSFKRNVIDDVVSSVQLAGSLLRLAGLPPENAFHHGDLCESLDTQAPQSGQCAFFEHYGAYWGGQPFYGVRTAEWKWIRYFGEANCEEMYHLATDPHELKNVAGSAEVAGIQAELANTADQWWLQTGGRDVAYYESDSFRRNEHNRETT